MVHRVEITQFRAKVAFGFLTPLSTTLIAMASIPCLRFEKMSSSSSSHSSSGGPRSPRPVLQSHARAAPPAWTTPLPALFAASPAAVGAGEAHGARGAPADVGLEVRERFSDGARPNVVWVRKEIKNIQRQYL